MRSLAAFAMVTLFAGAVWAQSRVVDPEIADRTASARRLLASQSPKDRAWAAHAIHSQGLTELIPDLIRELADVNIFAPSKDEEAYTYALFDALIQTVAQVAPESVERLYERYPAEVTLLWMQNPTSNDVLLRHRGKVDSQNFASAEFWSAMTAALVFRRDGRIAPALLTELAISHRFEITLDGHRLSESRQLGAVGCGSVTLSPGFPPIGRYEVVTVPRQADVLIVPSRSRPIYYRRAIVPTSGRAAFGQDYSAADLNESVAAYLPDLLPSSWSEKDVLSIVERRTSVRWTGPEAVREEIRRAIGAQAEDLRRLIRALQANGMLQAQAARSLDVRINVRIDHEGLPTPESLQPIAPVQVTLD